MEETNYNTQNEEASSQEAPSEDQENSTSPQINDSKKENK